MKIVQVTLREAVFVLKAISSDKLPKTVRYVPESARN